jgi:hypothetical protein
LPSQTVFEMIDTLCKAYLGLTPVILYYQTTMEELYALYVDWVLLQRRQKKTQSETYTNDNVKTITRPATTSIKNGGWY